MLPIILQSTLVVQPIDWTGLDRRFLNHGELEVLVSLVRSVAPKTMLEIGVNTGRTALAMLRNVSTLERYIGIDVPPDYVPALPVQATEVPHNPGYLAAHDPRFELIVSPRGSLDFRIEASGLPACDVVFIDGDHSCVAVVHDTALARNLVRPGGLIIWHDYHDQGTVDVKNVLDGYHRHGAKLFHIQDTWLAYERREAHERGDSK
jgi:predicted O-methyltransferase YrrM